jgi:hypothetical protein
MTWRRKPRRAIPLKILSASFGVALLAFGPHPAYSFDYNRFYANKLERIETGASVFHQRDQFAVEPSGRIDKIPGEADVNTIGPAVMQTRDSKRGIKKRVPGARSDLNMNTLYSDHAGRLQSDGECGPSPMTAAEIEQLVVQTAQTYGVDTGLAKAIAWTESRFDQTRNSDQGARGAMQLLPSTARGLGVRDICDPVSNIDGGVRHLKLMLDEFQNPILAAAAYNAGAQAVYDNGGVPPFPETVRYVAAVINHQMGLQIPRTSFARGVAASSDELASDVLGARGSRFVQGVMKF